MSIALARQAVEEVRNGISINVTDRHCHLLCFFECGFELDFGQISTCLWTSTYATSRCKVVHE